MVIIVITDGEATKAVLTEQYANEIHADGRIRVISIGTTLEVRTVEIRRDLLRYDEVFFNR